jgi:hypothetical protein
MSAYRMNSNYLYYFCLPILCLLNCVISILTYSILCLVISTLDVWLPLLNNVVLPVLYGVYLMSTKYDVCIPVLYLPSCMISAQLYDVCLFLRCMLNGMLSVQLYDTCLPIGCLPSFDFFLPYCLLNCVMSIYLFGVCST